MEAFILELPPNMRPRGQLILRLRNDFCGTVSNDQSLLEFQERGYMVGVLHIRPVGKLPASITATVALELRSSWFASTQAAVPPPTIMKSNVVVI